jgi:hypothetical protein
MAMPHPDSVSAFSVKLAVPKPSTTRGGRRKGLPLSILAVAALVPLVGGVVIIGGGAWWHFGSASAAVAFLRGDALVIEPTAIDLGPVSPGEEREVILRVSNLTGRIISINGMTSNFCGPNGCVSSLDRFPLDIAPWSGQKLTIHARAPLTQEYAMQLDAELYTSIGTRIITISGEVREAATTSVHPRVLRGAL